MAERILNIKESSTIKSATHDDDSQRLTVEFKSGHSGYYSGVSGDDATAFENADSPGRHHDIYFKKANVSYTKIK